MDKSVPETTRISHDLFLTGSTGVHRECHGIWSFSEKRLTVRETRDKAEAAIYVHYHVVCLQHVQ